MRGWDEGSDDDRAQRMIDAARRRGIRLSGSSRDILRGMGTEETLTGYKLVRCPKEEPKVAQQEEKRGPIHFTAHGKKG